MAEINFVEATAEPADLSLEPVDLPRRPVTPDPTVEIPDQLLSARRSFEARDDLASGKRNLNDSINDDAFRLAGSLAMQISSEEIKIELDVSNQTRGELDLDLEDPALFTRFRNPQLSRTLSVQYLVAMGLEQELQDDLREF